MTDWFLVPCLAKLWDEINAFAPNRDHASDGTIGDATHQAEKSDHDPDAAGRVHAIDVDSSGPWPINWSAERLAQLLLDRQRTGEDDRLQYLIYNRRIWSRSWGWAVRPYAGPSAHLEHIHLSARHDATRDHVQPWGILEEIDMTDDDIKKIAAAVWKSPLGSSGPTAAVALQSGYGLLNALLVMAKAEATEVPPSVQQLVDGVKAGLHASTPEQTAAMLKGILGPDAAAVGRILAA